MDNSAIRIFVLKLIIAILLLITYLYIEKLEKTGCECSEHPNRQFIKNFSIIGLIYYILTIIVNPANFNKLGSSFAIAYTILDIVFYFVLAFYFYYTIDYVRYLINEKCKCSEDMRRELILGGSIVELILIVMVFVTAMLIPVTGNCVNNAITSIPKTASEIKKTVQDPLSSIKNTPSNIKKVVSSFSSNSKKVLNSANKIIKKK